MIRMTPQLAEALERLRKADMEPLMVQGIRLSGSERREMRDFHIGEAAESVLAAYREAPVVEGKWKALQDERLNGEWWVLRSDKANHFNELRIPTDQRTAEMYRDYLNAADAALESRG